jgi:RecA/RadA recombinase
MVCCPALSSAAVQALDDALRIGVPPAAITELVGPASVGKSQFCYTLTLQVSSSVQHSWGWTPAAACGSNMTRLLMLCQLHTLHAQQSAPGCMPPSAEVA